MSNKGSVLLFCFTVLALGISVNGSKKDRLRIYEIKQGNFSVKVTNYGARIISVVLPDKNGELSDVVLGYDTIEEYKNDTLYFGAIVGRVANRIAGAKFTLNGTVYKLDANEGTNMLHGIFSFNIVLIVSNDTRHFGAIVGRVANRIAGAKFTLNGTVYKLDANEGTNMLHGGKKGFSQVAWKLKGYRKCGGPRRSPYITFTYHSVDGEEGFPGDVLVSVTYVILDPYGFTVNMEAEALNKPTPISLAQHTYWNLGGHNSGDILSDQLKIFGSRVTPVGEKLIPTGEIVPVKSTPYDFLEVREINGQMKQLPEGSRGYDINYVVDNVYGSKDNYAAYLYNKMSGREMRLWAGAPGLQLYTANYINGVKGKGGFVYQPRAALCLESQGFPDAVNHPNFPSQIVYPGQKYEHSMLFSFSIRKW